ncbi:MAG: methyltransferase domain-containing protein [Rhodospirillales bacterium]
MLDRLSASFRERRNRLLARRIGDLSAKVEQRDGRRLRVIDIGGAPAFWKMLQADMPADVTLVNIEPDPATPARLGQMAFAAVAGDARDLGHWSDGAFDLVVSNSVIEHVGQWSEIARAAGEMKRLAAHGWVQTPAFGFPVEPHFALPFVHWLPAPLRAAIVPHLPHQGYEHLRLGSVGDARLAVEEINLLTAREVRFLFPDAELMRERVLGLTKSFIAAWPRGWWR